MNTDSGRGPGTRRRGRAAGVYVFGVALFLLLCTANSGGYRYGASDQAFYVPAILARMDPSLFPNDGGLIASQARLTMIDESVALLAQIMPLPLPILLAGLYCVTLALLAGAAWWIGLSLYRCRWTAVALIAALTLRHAIARSGTNTLEGYFHPRQLAFSFGALAVAATLRGRWMGAAALVGIAAFLHPTTALWFAIWLAIAAATNERRLRWPLAAAVVLGAAAGGWALLRGPLAGRLVVMDPVWLETLASKDYLFPFEWPAWVWLLNLAYVPIIITIHRRRAALGLLMPGETGVIAGCLSLLVVFAVALPLNAARVALAVQLQTPRIFWMLDFVATAYVVWALAEGARAAPRRARITAAIILVASIARGTFVAVGHFPERRLVQLGVRDDDWGRVMAWARTTAPETGWLADPMHAIRYGTSVRVAGQRDVMVEAVKDAAIGMYARDVAMRTRERIAATGAFDGMTIDRARTLADRYALDYLVTEHGLDLPILFQSGALRVYRIREPGHDGPAKAGHYDSLAKARRDDNLAKARRDDNLAKARHCDGPGRDRSSHAPQDQ